jgi:UDP-glucose 4-epimerase
MSDLAVVTGATGVIGVPLVRALLDRGYDVRGIALDAGTEPGVEYVEADIRDPDAMGRALSGASLVFHLAAKLHTPNPDRSLRDEYVAINVDGTRNVVDAAARTATGRLVFFSTIDVYGPTAGRPPVDEDEQTRPPSLYSETKLAAEAVARQLPGTIVLRLASVYGPGMKGNYLRMLDAVARRRFPILGSGRNRRTLVHVDDVVAAAMVVATNAAIFPGPFNVTDGSVHTLREILDAMAGAVGVPPPRLRLPLAPVRVGVGVVERVLGSKAPLTRAAISKVTEDVAVSGRRFAQEFGHSPHIDLDAGWESVASWWRARAEP